MVIANRVNATRSGHDGVPRVLLFEPAAPVLSLGRRLHGLLGDGPSTACALGRPRDSDPPAHIDARAQQPPVAVPGHDRASLDAAFARGLEVRLDDRGGGATLHQPGQLVALVAWPLPREAVSRFVDATLRHLAHALHELGADDVQALIEGGDTGLWRGERKLLSAGLRHNHGIMRHGFALQIRGDLGHGRGLVLCGRRNQGFADLEDSALACAKNPVLAASTILATALSAAAPLALCDA